MSESRRRLNVLFVGALPPLPGGAVISMAQLLAGLAGLGHRVRAIAPVTTEALTRRDGFAARPVGVAVTPFEVPYYELATPIPPPDEYRTLEAAALERLVSAQVIDDRPDVVLIGRESYAWYVPALAARYRLPCILFVRGNPTRAILEGVYPEPQARHFLEQYGKVDLIVSVARYLADGLRRLGFSRVVTIPNAIDVEQFVPQPRDAGLSGELRLRGEDVVVVHASNLTALKRPLDVVASAARALHDNPDLVYVVVGDGAMRAPMEEACTATGIADRVRFTGWVDYERMPTYINLADIVVMASEGEGLARVYLETQACARLLLASDIPAAREAVTDGKTGLLFGRGDIDDLAAKTLHAAGCPGLRASIGRNARRHALRHSLPRAVEAYAAVLEDFLVREH
jgi:glycosyltransferase involved in cell wall biosynthesis